MDFTREPIIETVITPRDGHRIVVRSSKNPGQEEFFVDALEVVTFGHNCFFRSLERPRAFIVPVTDYEVLEVREPRIPLKSPSIDGIIKIGGSQGSSRSDSARGSASMQTLMTSSQASTHNSPFRDRGEERRDTRIENRDSSAVQDRRDREHSEARDAQISSDRREYQTSSYHAQTSSERAKETQGSSQEIQLNAQNNLKEDTAGDSDLRAGLDRRRDRRRNLRRRRNGRLDAKSEDSLHGGSDQQIDAPANDETELGSKDAIDRELGAVSSLDIESETLPHPVSLPKERNSRRNDKILDEDNSANQPSTLITSILPPPTTLIRDELARLRNNELYKGAFYIREQASDAQATDSATQQKEGFAENKVDDDDEDFIVSSSLRFDDDDDDSVNSDAYKATPVGRKEVKSSRKQDARQEMPQEPLRNSESRDSNIENISAPSQDPLQENVEENRD